MSRRLTVYVWGASAMWILGLVTLTIFATVVSNFPDEGRV